MVKATGLPMMRLASLMKILTLFALLTLSASGCKQSSGERCQLQSDCASGLVCVLPANGNCVGGGVCEPPVTPIKRCVTTADCDPGFTCQVSSDCTENGALVCTSNADMSVPADLSVPGDLLTTSTD